MATPTAAWAGLKSGTESRRSPRASEFWNITGNTSVAGDVVAFTPMMMKKPKLVAGAVSWSIVGNLVTVALLGALAAGQVVTVEVVGYP
jgi:hypothetical protein